VKEEVGGKVLPVAMPEPKTRDEKNEYRQPHTQKEPSVQAFDKALLWTLWQAFKGWSKEEQCVCHPTHPKGSKKEMQKEKALYHGSKLTFFT